MGVSVLGLPSATAAKARSAAQVFQVPPNGTFALRGHGWGHGHGMSQYGAYGAAKVKGLTYDQIVSFYYPGTTPTGLPLASNVRVLLHGTQAGQLPVAPRGGAKLTVTTTADGVPPCVLPDSLDDGKTPVEQWRARVITTASGAAMRIQSSTDGTTWAASTLSGCAPAWSKPMNGSITFDGGGITDLVRGGAVAPYRGDLRAAFTGTRIYVVNVVPIDMYLRSVVPSEMPSSWTPAALQAQAVAARTYAAYEMAHPKNKPYYDVYDDTRDQMYIGASHEAASTTNAIKATEDVDAQTGVILDAGDSGPAFTQFSSSNGGWTVYGGQPYLPAKQDPYDGLIPSSVHSWSTSVPASTIANAYGKQIGTLRTVAITGRDGHGQWGGRVTSVELRGSSGTVTLTGTDFRFAFGLRSEWFTVIPPPAAPTEVTATLSAGAATVGWQPPSSSGASVSGYRVVMQPGGASTTVAANARTATVSGLDPKTDYRATVTALSSVGPGWPTTVTTKVARLEGDSGAALAVASSQATFSDGRAKAVVLVRKQGAVSDGFAAAALADATHASVLLTSRTSVPAVTRTELRRVLPAGGTVYLLGPVSVISDDVRTAIHDLGYRVVRRDGATPAAVARSVARTIGRVHDVGTAVEVDASDITSAWVAGVIAAHKHGVLLLTANGAQAPETVAWLRGHPKVTRIAVGAAAAAADPSARAVTGAAPSDIAAAAASRWFGAPRFAAVVSPTSVVSGLVAAARLAIAPGPLLYADPTALPPTAASYVGKVRAALQRVDLIGDSMPYDNVESDTQAALLGRS